MLDHHSHIPLYHQLADLLRSHIDKGDIGPGDKIPSEPELCETYKLGRPTVRQATEQLVREHILERRKGSGTFVTEKPKEVDLLSLGGTLASFSRSGLDLQTRILSRILRRKVTEDEGNPFSGQYAYTMKRLGSIDRRPVLLESFCFSTEVFPDLPQQYDARSLSALVRDHYGLTPRSGRQIFHAIRAEGNLAEQFKVDDGTPLLRVQRTLDFPGYPSAVFVTIFCETGDLGFSQQIGDILHA